VIDGDAAFLIGDTDSSMKIFHVKVLARYRRPSAQGPERIRKKTLSPI
jgi:hypothetical protein